MTEDDFQYAIENTRVILAPERQIASFGSTSFRFYLISELMDQANEIRKTGRPARGRVLKIWDTGMSLNDSPIVGFRLEVHAEGVEPFEAETRALIGRLDVPQIQPGAELPVKYDPNDHTRVALDIYEKRK